MARPRPRRAGAGGADPGDDGGRAVVQPARAVAGSENDTGPLVRRRAAVRDLLPWRAGAEVARLRRAGALAGADLAARIGKPAAGQGAALDLARLDHRRQHPALRRLAGPRRGRDVGRRVRPVAGVRPQHGRQGGHAGDGRIRIRRDREAPLEPALGGLSGRADVRDRRRDPAMADRDRRGGLFDDDRHRDVAGFPRPPALSL